MSYAVWADLYSIGVPALDAQHQRLFELVNAFHQTLVQGAAPARLAEVFNALVCYAEEHFQAEERWMQHYRCPQYQKQRLEHDRFLQRVFDLNERFARGEELVDQEVDGFLREWLLDHVVRMDKQLEPHLRGRPAPEEQPRAG